MPAPTQLLDLIDRFQRNRDAYRSGKYNETQVRREFIDPLLTLLGWDVDNKAGYAEQYKQVVHEDAIKVGGSSKAPDYSLRIGGQRKLFVEAKKPAVNIKQDISPAFQVRRYAWSAKLPLSILTDFEEFAVYDCRNKPDKNDKASHARIMYFTYDQYAEKWDELVALFSPEAIMQGAFDKYVKSSKKKRGTAEVDDAFLAEISVWRDDLARNIALRNSGITTRQLNHAVQRTIDRLIFLRIAEDRGIEQYGRLRERAANKEVYAQLGQLFRQADAKYNSGLFHFKSERGRDDESLDTFTLQLTIDDKVLKQIIKRLYYPDSPYQFDVIPADILGQVYEQFLGKVIRLTAGGQAKIEEKPEVKKAGGVFYTPTYIVDYIVQQTVGKLLEGKKPGKAGGVSKLRILDPACGSGSFLIGAYQFFLDWHLREYLLDRDRWARMKAPTIYQNGRGEWQLTIGERKRILLNNIYGVDIDQQAVEVTKLSLLLKVMEGENEQTLGKQTPLLHLERVLPNLSANIQCGNSLIGPDFYDGQQMSLGILDEEEMYRINVFDWTAAFPTIVPWGGFDAVIGNPPYIKIQALKQWAPKEVEFYKERYVSATKGNYDIYVVFAEKGVNLLKQDGILGYILPHKFFQAQFGKPLRNWITQNGSIAEIIDFGAEQVFSNATTYTCLLFLQRGIQKNFRYAQISDLSAPKILLSNILGGKDNPAYHFAQQPQPSVNSEWHFFAQNEDLVLKKMALQPQTLGDITRKIFVGAQTSADKIFVLQVLENQGEQLLCYSKSLGREVSIEKSICKPFLLGKDIHRYEPVIAENIVLFPYRIKNSSAVLMDSSHIKDKYPLAWDYLLSNKTQLEKRERGRFKNSWWCFGRTQNLTEFETEKIMTPDICSKPQMTIDLNGDMYHTTTIYSFAFNNRANLEYEYFLGIMNSKLLWFFLQSTGTILRGGFIRFKTEYLRPFPLPLLDTSKPEENYLYSQMLALVRQILELNKRLAAAQTAHERTLLQRQIAATDRQIDQLVYQLYSLTPQEIAIVEGKDPKGFENP